MSGNGDDPVLDRVRLEAITAGSAGLAEELVTMLVGEASEIAGQLRIAAAEPDPDRTRRLLHALKGMAANVGAVRLQRAAEAFDRAELSDAPEVQGCIARLDGELAALSALR